MLSNFKITYSTPQCPLQIDAHFLGTFLRIFFLLYSEDLKSFLYGPPNIPLFRHPTHKDVPFYRGGALIEMFPFSTIKELLLLQHGLNIVRNFERRFSFGLDFIHRDSVSEFDEGQSICKIDVENTLQTISNGQKPGDNSNKK